MTKVIYPDGGLSITQAKNVDKVKDYLVSAAKISYNVPYDFQYKNYLDSLNVEKFISDLDFIKEEFRKIDMNYSSMNDDMSNDFKTFEQYKVSKRDSII